MNASIAFIASFVVAHTNTTGLSGLPSDRATSSSTSSITASTLATAIPPKMVLARANIFLNSSLSNSCCTSLRFGRGAVSARSIATGASLRSTISSAFRVTRSRFSCSDWRSFGVCSSAASKTASRVLYLLMSLAAVFSPTPGTPSRLSLESPRSAA